MRLAGLVDSQCSQHQTAAGCTSSMRYGTHIVDGQASIRAMVCGVVRHVMTYIHVTVLVTRPSQGRDSGHHPDRVQDQAHGGAEERGAAVHCAWCAGAVRRAGALLVQCSSSCLHPTVCPTMWGVARAARLLVATSFS